MARPSWDDYFLEIVDAVAKRATCNRGRSACVLVGEDGCILSTGYVGSPHGFPHCDDEGHLFINQINEDGETVSQHCIRTIHCEVNAVAQAARRGIALKGATAYITMEPCYSCAKMLLQCGVKRIVCKYQYRYGKLSRLFLKEAGVLLIVKNDEIIEYEHGPLK